MDKETCQEYIFVADPDLRYLPQTVSLPPSAAATSLGGSENHIHRDFLDQLVWILRMFQTQMFLDDNGCCREKSFSKPTRCPRENA